MGKPLASFCVKSWNGRRYIREALVSAFAQTYRPLEIIIVDDASTDGSWDEIESFCAAQPADPDVSVVVKRNPQNLGSVGNWEEICSLAHGEILVKADGDDVSSPDRTERIVSAWIADGKKAMAICHSGWQIGRRGERKGRLRQVTPGWPLGAAMAFSPRILEFFGRTADGSLVDDIIWTRRAQMLGSVITIPDRLVYYRLGSGETTDEWNIRGLVVHCTAMSLAALRSLRVDANLLPGPSAAESQQRLDDEAGYLSAKASLVSESSFRKRLAALRTMPPAGRFSVANFLRHAFLMPRPLSDVLLFLYVLARNTLRRL